MYTIWMPNSHYSKYIENIIIELPLTYTHANAAGPVYSFV